MFARLIARSSQSVTPDFKDTRTQTVTVHSRSMLGTASDQKIWEYVDRQATRRLRAYDNRVDETQRASFFILVSDSANENNVFRSPAFASLEDAFMHAPLQRGIRLSFYAVNNYAVDFNIHRSTTYDDFSHAMLRDHIKNAKAAMRHERRELSSTVFTRYPEVLPAYEGFTTEQTPSYATDSNIMQNGPIPLFYNSAPHVYDTLQGRDFDSD